MTYHLLQFVGPFVPGQTVADTDFPPGTDFDRLTRLKALELAPGQTPPDPPKVADLKRQLAVSQATIASLQKELAAVKAAVESSA